MINLAICAKCALCGDYSPSRADSLGNIVVFPSVWCGASELSLMGSSELPKKCAYILEQTVSEDDAWNTFEDLKEK